LKLDALGDIEEVTTHDADVRHFGLGL